MSSIPPRFTRGAGQPAPAPKPEQEVPEVPAPPKARSIATLGKVWECAPIWLTGMESKIDIIATQEALAAGLIPDQTDENGNLVIAVPDFTSEGQFCVLAGYMSHYDKVVYRQQTGVDMKFQTNRLLNIQDALNRTMVATRIQGEEVAKLADDVNAIWAKIAEAKQAGDTEAEESHTREYEIARAMFEVARYRDAAAEIGLTLHENGSISTREYQTPIYLSEEYVNLVAFILSRFGRIVGVTEEWFKRVAPKGVAASTPYFDKECFILQPVTEAVVANYVEVDNLFLPIREEEVGGRNSYVEGKEADEIAFYTILRLAHLYNYLDALKELKAQGKLTESEEADIDRLPLSGSAEPSPSANSA